MNDFILIKKRAHPHDPIMKLFTIRSISHDPDKPRVLMTTRGPIVVSFCASNRAITRDERSYEFLTRRPPILRYKIVMTIFVIRGESTICRSVLMHSCELYAKC